MARAVCEKKQAVEAMVKICGEEDGHEKVEEGAGVSGLKVLGWSEGEHAEVVELPSLLNSKITRSYARC